MTSEFEHGAAFVDGELVPIERARISLVDTGFSRSDVTYDVVAVWDGAFFRLDDHLDRFERGCRTLRLTLPYDRAEMTRILLDLARVSGLREAYVEMLCTRGVARQGSRDPRTFENRFYAYAIPYVWLLRPEQAEAGMDAVITRTVRRIPTSSVDPTVKNFHWGDLTRGLFEAYDRGAHYPILLDQARGWAVNYSTAIEDRFPDFAAWASARDGEYHLGADPGAVRATFLRLAARLDREPLPWPGGGGTLSGNVLRDTMLSVLYSDSGFPRLAGLMRAALTRGPLPALPSPPEAELQNSAAVLIATICNDVRWPPPGPEYRGAVARNREAFPLTAGMPVNIFPCAFWPEPFEPPVRVSAHGPSNVLLVQNLRDPSTPHRGALQMRAALGERARMVSVDSGGHGAYLANGNPCGDRTVTEFLVTGTRPDRDIRCPG